MPIKKPIFDDVKPFPGEMAELPPRDHNRPPPEEIIPQEFRAALIGEKAEFFEVLERYLGKGDPNSEDYREGVVDRAVCQNDDHLGRCGDVVKALRAMDQLVAKVHKAVKEPYLLAGRLCDAEKNALVGRIAAGRDKVEAKMNKYAADKREAERKERQRIEDERRRLEALARENNVEAALPPAAPPPKAEPVRSDGGSTVSLQTEWLHETDDYDLAFKLVSTDAKVREAIDAAIKRIVKATKGAQAIPGVRIYESVKTSAR